VINTNTKCTVFALLLSTTILVSCGGSGGDGSNAGFSVRASDFRRGIESFRESTSVNALLDRNRGGLTISPYSSPPNIEGEYSYRGRIDYSELDPVNVGQSISGTIRFFDQGGGLISISEDSPVLGTVTASGWFISGSSVSDRFTVCYALEANVDLNGIDCTEADVGIISGTRLFNGDLELEIGFVAVGLRGECVDVLRDRGISLSDILGKSVVSDVTAVRVR